MELFQHLSKLELCGLGRLAHRLISNGNIGNDEKLYRRVRDHSGNYKKLEDGRYRVSSAAFGDRGRKPSVDRAILHNNDPKKTQRESTDFVTRVMCHEVRGILDVRHTINGREQQYAIDAKPDPIRNDPNEPNNLAHSLIIAAPEIPANPTTVFKKLTIALARIANSHWEIGP
jgi:hypothetical protein